MSTLKIYGTVKSRTARTLWMAEELGIPYELVAVDYRARETRTPAFLAINPNGHVPAVDDGGLRLHESMAINLYLARRLFRPSSGILRSWRERPAPCARRFRCWRASWPARLPAVASRAPTCWATASRLPT